MSTSAVLAQTVPVPDGGALRDAASTASGPAGGEVYRLSPAEIEAALDAAAARNASQLPQLSASAAPVSGNPVIGYDGRPHGTVGMMVGTGGTRAVWGSTVVPLGANGVAAFSFSTGRWPGMPY